MPLESRPYERRVKKSILIDHAMELHTGATDCVLQAGGHVGVWPNRLTEYFNEVYTFEPHLDNYRELLKNTEGKDQIKAYNWALGFSPRAGQLKFSDKSTGMHHIAQEGDQDVGIVSIDWFCEKFDVRPDALFLDVEGYELFVLMGAERTIKENLPLISCEENECGKRYGVKPGELAEWLSRFGYNMRRKYKKDLIFCPS